MKTKIYTLILALIITGTSFGQGYNANYWHQKHIFTIDMGMVVPATEFASTDTTGLFAQNGFTFFMDYNYGLKYGFKLGAFFDYNGFGFDEDKFAESNQIPELEVVSKWNVSRLGATLSYNLPIMFNDEVCMNLYGKVEGGARFVSIPKMLMTYGVTENRFTETEYSSSTSSYGFYGYSGGVQLIFNRFGIDFLYKNSMGTSQTVPYTVKGISPQGDEVEEEYELTGKFNFTGFQAGVVFWF